MRQDRAHNTSPVGTETASIGEARAGKLSNTEFVLGDLRP